MIQNRSGRIQCGDGVGRAAIRGGKMTGDKPKEFGCLGIVDEVETRKQADPFHQGIKLAEMKVTVDEWLRADAVHRGEELPEIGSL